MKLLMHKLMSDKPIAVHFNSIDEANLFFREMKLNYPEKVLGWSEVIYVEHYARNGGVCYCPYFNDRFAGMTHGNRGIYERYGTQVIDFQELLYDNEEEIAESDLSLDFLLQ